MTYQIFNVHRCVKKTAALVSSFAGGPSPSSTCPTPSAWRASAASPRLSDRPECKSYFWNTFPSTMVALKITGSTLSFTTSKLNEQSLRAIFLQPLRQWCSTGVPWHTRRRWADVREAANYYNFLIFKHNLPLRGDYLQLGCLTCWKISRAHYCVKAHWLKNTILKLYTLTYNE